MAAGHLAIPVAASTAQWVGAASAIAVAVVVAVIIDRAFGRRSRRLAEVVARGQLTAETDTRLRFVRRLLVAIVLLIGVAVALSQFTGLGRVAGSILASSAIAAAVIGFAARQTLANLVAGIMLAITQPLRVGDWVTFEDRYGVVEDVRLNYTLLRTPSEQRVLIPNERLAAGVLVNETLISDSVGLDITVWVPPEADADRAVSVLEDETGCHVAIAEAVPWGVRIEVSGESCPPPLRPAREAALRTQCLRRLRAEGLLPG
jgi:small-conductance mechanosensitive channel